MLIVVGGSLFCLIGFLILISLGQHSGVEFSPDDFSRRNYSQIQLPIINYTYQPLTYFDDTDETSEFLQLSKLIPPSKNKIPVWHTVSDSKLPLDSTSCDARFLCDLLDERDDNFARYWLVWTQDHPDMAPVLWANVSSLARDYLYWSIPQLMDIARTSRDAEAFDRAASTYVARIYYENGERFLRDDDGETAVERLSKSIDLHPTQDAYQARARAYQKLGNQQQADADLAKANSASE